MSFKSVHCGPRRRYSSEGYTCLGQSWYCHYQYLLPRCIFHKWTSHPSCPLFYPHPPCTTLLSSILYDRLLTQTQNERGTVILLQWSSSSPPPTARAQRNIPCKIKKNGVLLYNIIHLCICFLKLGKMLSLPSSPPPPQVKAYIIVLLENLVYGTNAQALSSGILQNWPLLSYCCHKFPKSLGKLLQNSLVPSVWNVVGRKNQD